jgi:hypothetical protein
LRDLVSQSIRLRFQFRWLRTVGSLQCIPVALDAVLDLLLTLVDLARCEVAVASVDGFELAAIDGNQRLREQLEIATQNDEPATDIANACAVVPAEVSNRLEVRCQTTREPLLDVALAFALQTTTRLNPVQAFFG